MVVESPSSVSPWAGVRRTEIPHRRPGSITAAALVVLALAVAGCRGRQPAAPAPSSPQQGTPAEPRVGVVDLSAVARAHPRWAELDTLARQAAEIEVQLGQVPPPPATLGADVQQALDVEAKQLREGFQQELDALREDARRRLDAEASAIREEDQTKFEADRKQLEAEAERQLKAKRDELHAKLVTAEQEIREEYRYPLLNLRLRAEVAGLTSEAEARQVLRELQGLQQEREDRIRAKAEEIDQAFQEFRKAKEAEVNAELKAMQDELNAEGQRRLDARRQELEAELARVAKEREQAFQERLTRRRQELLAAAEAQVRQRQDTFLQDVDARTQRLRAELAGLQQQRLRLEESILAEVKVEVAAIAQEQKLDLVLTRYIANVGGIDITADVVKKLKR